MQCFVRSPCNAMHNLHIPIVDFNYNNVNAITLSFSCFASYRFLKINAFFSSRCAFCHDSISTSIGFCDAPWFKFQ